MSSEQLEEAKQAARETAEYGRVFVKGSEKAMLREYLLSDPFDFAKVVCNYPDLTDRFHRPAIYIITGQIDKLIALLDNPEFNSYVIEALRYELVSRGIDWHTPHGYARFHELLQWINIRFYRGSGKSSVGTHASVLWFGTRNPNETIALISGNDDGAWAFCQQIADTMHSDIYRDFFPERIPKGRLDELITRRRIWFGGRNITHPQWTVEARGYTSNWTRTHFNRFFLDDVVARETCSAPHLKAAHGFLAGLPGMWMPMVPIYRHHIGTIYDEKDDNYVLSRADGCLTIMVPIMTYDHEITDVTELGTPTNPEWHDLTRIRAIQSAILNDPDEGPISWRRNFLLDPGAGGGRMFPPSLVDNSCYQIERVA